MAVATAADPLQKRMGDGAEPQASDQSNRGADAVVPYEVERTDLSGEDGRSAPGVQQWVDAVKEVIAENGVFPANGVVQRMRAGIAPMPVQIVRRER
jgi:hypothetical protein